MEEMPAAMCLIGNKMDLDDVKEREVSTETGETFAKVLHYWLMVYIWIHSLLVLDLWSRLH